VGGSKHKFSRIHQVAPICRNSSYLPGGANVPDDTHRELRNNCSAVAEMGDRLATRDTIDITIFRFAIFLAVCREN